MRFIPRPVHGILDYLTGVLLGASPWIFGFADQHVAPTMAMVVGGAALLYSFFTDYELGVVRMFPFPVHLFLDLVSGVALALSPALFAIRGTAAVVFVAFGVFEIGSALFTRASSTRSGAPHMQ